MSLNLYIINNYNIFAASNHQNDRVNSLFECNRNQNLFYNKHIINLLHI